MVNNLQKTVIATILFFIVTSFILLENVSTTNTASVTASEKETLKIKTLEMFDHAYGAYKKYAHPADELMPLSCKGRYRGSERDRGDIDEALGNFSLTLIDTLDTLVVLGKVDEFDTQVKYVIENVSFNADAVVSVFETNIRVLGGLLGAHSVAVNLKESGKGVLWYKDQLLLKAVDVGDRLLAAFNTSTGIPYPKVNLRYGIKNPNSRVGHETDTCTACAGTMIMEFGALSRLSGKPIYEEKAHKAMEALWRYRSRHSDLVGTTINIHNGEWIRRDSGIGAGIDSYYEYCLKAYILLGDDSYLDKFNKHYAAINKYVRQGYMLTDVFMHQPNRRVRNSVDSLQAFWPGLQVLKGDLKPAIETHEMLYNVAKKYKFLPESFSTNLELNWAQHPLRPEFVESTYFLYQATKDPYYLTVGKHVLDTLEKHARVPCGFAAFSDLRTLAQEDKMDSFVLAETFKYLYLLFSEESQHVINIHDFIFTTEAHLLPLYLSILPSSKDINDTSFKTNKSTEDSTSAVLQEDEHTLCPNERYPHNNLRHFAETIRQQVNINGKFIQPSCKPSSSVPSGESAEKVTEKILSSIKLSSNRERKLKAKDFIMSSDAHLKILKELGITLQKETNGKVQLVHQAGLASSVADAEEGILFMQEMIHLAKQRGDNTEFQPRVLTIISPLNEEHIRLPAGSAQFGADLGRNELGLTAEAIETIPYRACEQIENKDEIFDRIAIIERGECMFIDKVRLAQSNGALGVVIVDHTVGTSAETSQSFGMSGDSNPNDVNIPSVFLFKKEGDLLRKAMQQYTDGYIEVKIAAKDGAIVREKPSDSKVQKQPQEEPIASRQEVHMDNNGRKVITTISEKIGADSDGIVMKSIQKVIKICPTPECDHGVITDIETVREAIPSQQKFEEKKQTAVEIPLDFDEKTSNTESGILDDEVSEQLKEKLRELSTGSSVCTSAGCFDSLEKLQSMNTLADGLLQQISKIRDQLKEPLRESSRSTTKSFIFAGTSEKLNQQEAELDSEGSEITGAKKQKISESKGDNDNKNLKESESVDKVHDSQQFLKSDDITDIFEPSHLHNEGIETLANGDSSGFNVIDDEYLDLQENNIETSKTLPIDVDNSGSILTSEKEENKRTKSEL